MPMMCVDQKPFTPYGVMAVHTLIFENGSFTQFTGGLLASITQARRYTMDGACWDHPNAGHLYGPDGVIVGFAERGTFCRW